MAEVPSIVFLAREFAKHCDGFSIGSNDLTQLVLGADRDSETLGRMGYFDERDPAVLEAIHQLIRGAHAEGRTVGICGQGPSVYPEFAEFLVREGIDSISLNADTVLSTIAHHRLARAADEARRPAPTRGVPAPSRPRGPPPRGSGRPGRGERELGIERELVLGERRARLEPQLGEALAGVGGVR